MNRQIKRILLAELSSKRKLAISLNEKIPAMQFSSKSKMAKSLNGEIEIPTIVNRSNDDVTFYMLLFDRYNKSFNFETWMRSDDDTFYLKKKESYTIDDLKQKLDLSEVWFEPFVNEE